MLSPVVLCCVFALHHQVDGTKMEWEADEKWYGDHLTHSGTCRTFTERIPPGAHTLTLTALPGADYVAISSIAWPK